MTFGSGTVDAAVGPITEESEENIDLDYFDVQDLGRLRRRLRTGIEGFQRERELYLELVRQYLEVGEPQQCVHPRSSSSFILSCPYELYNLVLSGFSTGIEIPIELVA